MLKIIIPIIAIVLIAYILLCIFMYCTQRRLLFFPPKPDALHYEWLTQNQIIQNWEIETKDGNRLDGWQQIDPHKKYSLLYFGWNGEETSYFVENTDYTGANIISFNYRWYGRSTGVPSEKTLFADALLQYDYLRDTLQIKPENIIVMGRSLGTGVATYLSSQRPVEKVILVTPYDSVESVASESYFFVPVSLLLTNKFDSLQYAKVRTHSLLCIYGGRDTTIRNHHTENLLSHWRGSVEKVLIPEATHEDILGRVELIERIDRFISEP